MNRWGPAVWPGCMPGAADKAGEERRLHWLLDDLRGPRDMTVAVLGVGYGDGLVRGADQGAHMLIRGRRVGGCRGSSPGGFSVADITDVPDVRLGDEVTVFGEADGGSVSIRNTPELYGGHPARSLPC